MYIQVHTDNIFLFILYLNCYLFEQHKNQIVSHYDQHSKWDKITAKITIFVKKIYTTVKSLVSSAEKLEWCYLLARKLPWLLDLDRN
jgi:hypothetical protein